jgi:hypothetical protein
MAVRELKPIVQLPPIYAAYNSAAADEACKEQQQARVCELSLHDCSNHGQHAHSMEKL